jgi:hypothetical protein
MTEQKINAALNPTLANQLVEQAINEEPEAHEPTSTLVPPSDGLVTLPGGFITFAGEVIKTAEVRELNGKDEEAIARIGGGGRSYNTILSRAVVKVGDLPADEKILDNMFAGDRDALLVGIYRATFGNEAVLAGFCGGCKDYKDVSINVNEDISYKTLNDPIEEREFEVQGKKNLYVVTLPTGVTQRELRENDEANYAENITTLLEGTVVRINGRNVFSKSQVQELGIVDRNKIAEELVKRTPGPKFEDVVVKCPDCESEVRVSISIGALFRL